MPRRTYGQFCGLAHALDVVGERWTLLMVRELMTGPKRYSDIAEHLPGIGPSLLSDRLKQLEADGVIDRVRLAPPAASVVYQLTEAGRELGRAVMPLALWGVRHAAPADPGTERIDVAWTLLAFTDLLDPEHLQNVAHTYRFEVDGSSALLRIKDGHADIERSADEQPVAAVIRTDAVTLAAIGANRISVTEAVEAGRLESEGDPNALATLVKLLARLP